MVANQEGKWEKMKVLDFLKPSAIKVELTAATKKGVLEELVALLAADGAVKDAAGTVEVLLERERIGSTGLGQGIAIPHAKTDQVKDVVAAFGLSRRGVQFNSLDGEPAHIFFLLIAPPEAAAQHLKSLAKVSHLLKNKFFRQSLREAKDVPEILKIIRDEDQF